MLTALSWSGGKDSALTLWTLRGQGVEPEALITTITEEYDRISMHGVSPRASRHAGDRGRYPPRGGQHPADARQRGL